MSYLSLLSPITIGNMRLTNRVIMAPLTRLRSADMPNGTPTIGGLPTDLMAQYYTQRATAGMIITEAILGYLGLRLRPSTNPKDFFLTSWGGLLLDGQSAINAQPWVLLFPSICVALVVLAFTFLGDGLRDVLDPKAAR